jgi:hypothetical protein
MAAADLTYTVLPQPQVNVAFPLVRRLALVDFDGRPPWFGSLAYGTLGGFTAGQTWTTFTDHSAAPQTLDLEGGVSNVNCRQGLVRWEQPIFAGGLSAAVALEDPRIMIEAPTQLTGVGRTESPDFITRLRYTRDWGNIQGAFVLRELGFQRTDMAVIKGTAWGFNFAGSALLVEGTLIANPYERVFVGIEYLYGIRQEVSGAQGTAHRVQTSFGFFLP